MPPSHSRILAARPEPSTRFYIEEIKQCPARFWFPAFVPPS
jgi:hypothetical protein